MVTISLLLSSLDALRYFTTPRLDSYLSCIDGGAFLINDFSLAIVEAARSFFKYRLILGTSIDSHSWTKPREISSSNEHNCERGDHHGRDRGRAEILAIWVGLWLGLWG